MSRLEDAMEYVTRHLRMLAQLLVDGTISKDDFRQRAIAAIDSFLAQMD